MSSPGAASCVKGFALVSSMRALLPPLGRGGPVSRKYGGQYAHAAHSNAPLSTATIADSQAELVKNSVASTSTSFKARAALENLTDTRLSGCTN